MQGIEFDEEKNIGGFTMKTAPAAPTGKPSPMFSMLEKIGVADKSMGNLILLGVAVVFIGITFYLYAKALGKSVPSSQNVEQITAQIRVMREMQAIK